ncbi:Cobalamin biosynthesis protein CbiG (CbiG) [Commensalibacter communis]|uniref:cobalamin biosynthesis protein n=1 Tax=Commensalibacter communis TaxID=2972786 RepID=UPI0022FF652A|nr:cobalamin biosynthesis protein [Commensalibacter communis]CAI3923866.1 Cobalamin biosynthesis protein CbiG (CbiG) [Commensalibacter communis]CAI3935535.1 Cobalamin biosynthesis protein CbiG (CbiG) [Commensalibacter communis]
MQTIISNNSIEKNSLSIKPVIVGIGFSKNISAVELIQTLETLLTRHQYQATDIALPAFKQQDQNTINLISLSTIPIHFIPHEILLNLQTQCRSFSKLSYHHTGLGAVAEACALALIHKNGRLLIPKMIYNKISFSIAIKGYYS